MKSNSEPLEIHHGSEREDEFSLDSYEYFEKGKFKNSKQQTKQVIPNNYSDTQAMIMKNLNEENELNLKKIINDSGDDNSYTNAINSVSASSIKSTNKSFNEPKTVSITVISTTASNNDDKNTKLKVKQLKSLNQNTSTNTLVSKLSIKNSKTIMPLIRTQKPICLRAELNDLFLNKYSNKTLIGNWVEDRNVNEIEINNYLHDKHISEMFCSSSDFFNQSATLSVSNDEYLHYEDHIILKCEENSRQFVYTGLDDRRNDCYLHLSHLNGNNKANCKERVYQFENEYPVIGSPFLQKNYSMVFKVVPVDKSTITSNSSCITYGQHFYLCTIEGDYYLYSENNIHSKTKYSNLSSVSFTKFDKNLQKNFKWMFLPIQANRLLPFEYESKPVDTMSRVLIKHVCSDHYLIVYDQIKLNKNLNNKFCSYYEIACDSLIARRHYTGENNQWKILKDDSI